MVMDTSSDDEHYEYQKYLSTKEEWPGYRKTPKFHDVAIFIQEICRLIPYVEDSYFKFHPLNMSDITIGQVEIVGIILKIIQKQNCYDITVNDGTGAITVIHKVKNFEMEENEKKRIDEKHERLARVAFLAEKWLEHDSTSEPLPLSFPKIRPSIEYDSKIPVKYRAYLEHKWYEEVNYGLLGKPIELCDYINVKGFIQLSFDQYPTPVEEISFKDICVATPTIVVSTNHFKRITEHDYNHKILEIVNEAKKRYERPE